MREFDIKYAVHSRHDNFIILYDKEKRNFCIHSKNENDDGGMIKGFEVASVAIDYAVKEGFK